MDVLAHGVRGRWVRKQWCMAHARFPDPDSFAWAKRRERTSAVRRKRPFAVDGVAGSRVGPERSTSSARAGPLPQISTIISVAPPVAKVATSAAAACPSSLLLPACTSSALSNHNSAMK